MELKKWYLSMEYLIILLFQWGIVRVRRQKYISLKRPPHISISAIRREIIKRHRMVTKRINPNIKHGAWGEEERAHKPIAKYILLIIITVLIYHFTGQFAPIVFGAWLPKWKRRRYHIINAITGGSVNYQIKLRVYRDYFEGGGSIKGGHRWRQTNREYRPIGSAYAPNKPNAIYRDGVTYMTYLREDTKTVRVLAYNHDTNTWGSSYIIATNPTTDIHRAPAIGILSTDKLIVMYGSHNSEQYYKVSTDTITDIKADLTKMNNWGSETQYSTESRYTYPKLCSFSDKLVIFLREHDAPGDWTNVKWFMDDTADGITWTGRTMIVDHMADGSYWNFIKVGDNIYASGHERLNAGNRRNVYFAYSTDKGANWKEADGTALAFPLNSTAKILDSGDNNFILFSSAPIPDENNKPIILVRWKSLVGDAYYYKLVTYDAQIGSSGSWSWGNVRDQDNNTILVDENTQTEMFLSQAEGKPVFYAQVPENGVHYMRRYCRLSGKTYRFGLTWKDEYADISGSQSQIGPIHEMSGTELEVITGEDQGTGNRDIQLRGPFAANVDANVDCGGKCNNDFSDIRFTDDDGSTELDYWIEEQVDGDYADIWVEVADDVSSEQKIYIYYWNKQATYTNPRTHGEDTFIFFDGEGFGGAVDWTVKWQSTDHTKYTIVGNELKMAGGIPAGTDLINTLNTYGGGFAAESKIKDAILNENLSMMFPAAAATWDTKDKEALEWSLNRLNIVLNNVSSKRLNYTDDITNYFRLVHKCPSTGDAEGEIWLVDADQDELEHSSSGAPAYTTAYPSFYQGDDFGYIDFVFVRNYVAGEGDFQEDVHGEWGDEEKRGDVSGETGSDVLLRFMEFGP